MSAAELDAVQAELARGSEGGDTHHSSASQIENWRDCNRKWAWRYIAKIKQPPNIYAAAGTLVHDASKAWLTRGELPPVDSDMYKIFAPMVPHMPKPGTCTEVDDSRFELTTDAGIIVGYVDAEVAPGPNGEPPQVHDWKSTSDLRYAKPAEVLDPQRVIYGVRTLERWNVDEADLHWLYVLRGVDKKTGAIVAPKKPKVRPIHLRVNLSVLDKPWAQVLEDVEDMGRARASGRAPKDYDYDPKICEKYGGCPYVAHCNLTPTERLRGHMSAMSLKDRMKARGGDVPVQAAASVPPQAAPAAPVARINPPESQLPPPAAPAAPPQQGTLAKLFGKKAAPAAAPAQAAAPASAAAPVVAQAPAAPPAVTQAVPAAEPIPAAQTPTAQPKHAPGPVSAPAAAKNPWGQGFALFIDCAPVKTEGGGLISFGALINPVLEQLANEHGVPHYRMIPNNFGSAPAIFATALGRYLEDSPLPGHIGVSMSLASTEAKDGLEVMMQFAGLVVRGM